MLNFSYKEIDIMLEMINFKAIDKNKLIRDNVINKVKLREIFKTVNSLLELEKLPMLVDTGGYIFHYGFYRNHNMRIKEIFRLKDSIRRDIIYLFLLISRKRFNIMRFGEKFWQNNENRKTLKKDLRKILGDLGIPYHFYMTHDNPHEIIRSRIVKYEKVRLEHLTNILLKKWERVYSGIGTFPEIIEIGIIREELPIRNLEYVYSTFSDFFNSWGKVNSKLEKIRFLAYFIINLHNPEINTRKRVAMKGVSIKRTEGFRKFEDALIKIEKSEKVKIYSYFKVKLYKYLLKKSRADIEYFYGDAPQETYGTAEEILEYENRKLSAETSNKENRTDEAEAPTKAEEGKIAITLVYDLEDDEIRKNIKTIRKIFSLFKVEDILSIDVLQKKLLSDETSQVQTEGYGDAFRQILIISNGDIKNMITNYTISPVYYLKLSDLDNDGNRKGSFMKNAEYGRELSEIHQMMRSYMNNYGRIYKPRKKRTVKKKKG